MSNEDVFTFLVLIIGGSFLLYLSIMSLRGYYRGLYLIKGIPLAAPASIAYTFIPGGIGAFLFAIAFVIPGRRIGAIIGVTTGALVMISALALMLWQPRWLKPWWLIWLEDHYPLLLHTLLEEARQAGKTWETEIQTEEDLAQWAERTVARYRRDGLNPET